MASPIITSFTSVHAEMDFSLIQSLIGCLSAWLIGLSKSGVPGAAMVTVPLMADQFGAKVSVGLILPTLITGDICALSGGNLWMALRLS